MSDVIIYKGRGNPEMYDDFMDFINYVFGFNGNEQDFKKLLPKLYNPDCNPCYNNYIVTENGKLKAAIGAFDSILAVGGEELHCRGIGNVAVHPYSRSKGYMIDCMNMAIDDMIKDGVDCSILGGIRQRYNWFGYEYCGQEFEMSISSTNLRHCFKDVPFVELEIRDVKSGDSELINKMYTLHSKRPMRTVRSREKFFDICSSWRAPVRAVLKCGEFIGYFVGGLGELTLVDNNDFDDVVRNYVKNYGEVTIHLPMWDTDLIDRAERICGHENIGHCDMFSVYNYKRVIGALLKFKASREELVDAEFTILIHGKARDERLKISVKDNVTSVEDYYGDCTLEIGHREAATLFFGLRLPYLKKLSPAARAILPLPLYVESADHV